MPHLRRAKNTDAAVRELCLTCRRLKLEGESRDRLRFEV